MTRPYAAAARFCTSLEYRPNALDGRRRLDGPDYRPFSDFTISQVGICRGKFRAHRMILAADRRTRFQPTPPSLCQERDQLRLGVPGLCLGEPGKGVVPLH
jgi:hypothetical protein